MGTIALSYCLDASDRVVSVSDTYDQFGSATNGKVEDSQVIGLSIWSFVQGLALQQALKRFLDRSRTRPGWLPYRCDSPVELRLWKIEAGLDGAALRVTFTQLASRERPPAKKALKGLARPIQLCSWCNGVLEGGRLRWLPLEQAEQLAGMMLFSPSTVSHILCPLCQCLLHCGDPLANCEHLEKLEVSSRAIVRLTEASRTAG